MSTSPQTFVLSLTVTNQLTRIPANILQPFARYFRFSNISFHIPQWHRQTRTDCFGACWEYPSIWLKPILLFGWRSAIAKALSGGQHGNKIPCRSPRDIRLFYATLNAVMSDFKAHCAFSLSSQFLTAFWTRYDRICVNFTQSTKLEIIFNSVPSTEKYVENSNQKFPQITRFRNTFSTKLKIYTKIIRNITWKYTRLRLVFRSISPNFPLMLQMIGEKEKGHKKNWHRHAYSSKMLKSVVGIADGSGFAALTEHRCNKRSAIVRSKFLLRAFGACWKTVHRTLFQCPKTA